MNMAKICQVKIPPQREIIELAKSFQKQTKLSSKDAIHVATAEYVNSDYFLTCDDKLIKQALKLDLSAKVMNPVDYIRQ